MQYQTTYWHYQSPRRHYANHWAMCIDKWYNDLYVPAISLDITIHAIDGKGDEITDTVMTFDKFGVEELARRVEGVMKDYKLDFDAQDKEDLVTVLIEILTSNKKGKVF